MSGRLQAREQIDNTALADLEFLVMDLEGTPVAHVYAPFWRRNWVMTTIADYNEHYKGIRVDRRTAQGWEGDVDWRKLGN